MWLRYSGASVRYDQAGQSTDEVTKMLVLDEADEMLSRGFKEQIYDIYRYLPPSTQIVSFQQRFRLKSWMSPPNSWWILSVFW